jgi:hypothetical protein
MALGFAVRARQRSIATAPRSLGKDVADRGTVTDGRLRGARRLWRGTVPRRTGADGSLLLLLLCGAGLRRQDLESPRRRNVELLGSLPAIVILSKAKAFRNSYMGAAPLTTSTRDRPQARTRITFLPDPFVTPSAEQKQPEDDLRWPHVRVLPSRTDHGVITPLRRPHRLTPPALARPPPCAIIFHEINRARSLL